MPRARAAPPTAPSRPEGRRLATLTIALASCAATWLAASNLAGDPWTWSAATTWLVHADGSHLLLDLAAFAAVGCWLEPRAGSGRVLLWSLLAAALGSAVHALAADPGSRLFGLSGVGYTLVFAAALGWGRDRVWGWTLVLALAAYLLYESATGRSPALQAGAALADGASGPLLIGHAESLRPAPAAHLACALLGATLGVSARHDPRPHRQPCRSALSTS